MRKKIGRLKQVAHRLFPNGLTNTFWHLPMAWLAVARYGFPAKKLTLIGVTGTDGKTTTVYLLNHILKSAGKRTVMISSVAAEINGRQSPTGFHITSPHPFQVQKYLRQAVKQGVKYGVLEVTSHALVQHRFAGCHFKVGVITNIRPDHLDYHRTFANYLAAKMRLLQRADIMVVNGDDSVGYQSVVARHALSAGKFTRRAPAAGKLFVYSIDHKADVTPKKVGSVKLPKTLPGKYNLSNILAAAAAAFSLGIGWKRIKQAISVFPGVPGRFEEVATQKNFRIIIDFAHTPYALRALLTTLRKQVKHNGRLIAVFGCAAERGKERRQMGKIAAELAEITIITAEDPRFEGVAQISREIADWATRGGALEMSDTKLAAKTAAGQHRFTRIADRQEAINYAVRIARKNDIIVLCGKGHEQSMNFAGIEYPWDERQAVEQALKCK